MIRKIDWANDALPDGRPLLRVAQELEAAHGAKVAAQQLSALMGRPSFDDRQLCGILRKHGRLPRVSPFGAAAIPDSRISPVAVCAPPSTTPAAPSPLPAQAERGRGAFPGRDSFPVREMEPPRPIRAPSPVQREGLAAFLFDLHAPLLDAAAWFCARSWLRANRPAVVVLGGDVGEWESCSMHGGSPASPSFLADVRETAGVLRDIREDAPDAELYFLEGNHETRLSRMIAERAPAVAGAVTVQDALELDRWRCRWIPEDEQPLRLPGGLVLLHGHQLGGRPSVYYSRRLADVYGSPGSVVVAGHGHKSQRHRRPMAEGHAEGISVPCLRQLKAGWLHGEVSGWTHGFAVATMIEGRRSTVEVLDIEDGIACWGGRRYAA